MDGKLVYLLSSVKSRILWIFYVLYFRILCVFCVSSRLQIFYKLSNVRSLVTVFAGRKKSLFRSLFLNGYQNLNLRKHGVTMDDVEHFWLQNDVEIYLALIILMLLTRKLIAEWTRFSIVFMISSSRQLEIAGKSERKQKEKRKEMRGFGKWEVSPRDWKLQNIKLFTWNYADLVGW